ncbi:hypothetical protein ACFL3B_02390 [Gemmatimonadota bacterium]
MFWVMGFLLVFVALMIPTLAIVLNSPVVKGYFHGTDPVKLGEVIDRVRAIEDELAQMAGDIEALQDETKFVQRLLDDPDPGQLKKRIAPPEFPLGTSPE